MAPSRALHGLLSGAPAVVGWSGRSRMITEGVYFIAESVAVEPMVKIGLTIDIKRRFTTLNGQSARPLELVLFWPINEIARARQVDGRTNLANIRSAERLMHEHWAEYRAGGEWFRLVGDLRDFVDDPWAITSPCSVCESPSDIMFIPAGGEPPLACRGAESHPICVECGEHEYPDAHRHDFCQRCDHDADPTNPLFSCNLLPPGSNRWCWRCWETVAFDSRLKHHAEAADFVARVTRRASELRQRDIWNAA